MGGGGAPSWASLMVRLRVLGGFSLSDEVGRPIEHLAQRRAEAVLALLARAGDLGCTRDRLIALLWPDADEAHSRHNLSNVLHLVRGALGPSAVQAVGDSLRLDFDAVDVDVHRFTEALHNGRHADAIAAYAGPFLAGVHVEQAQEFDEWAERERATLFRQCSEALDVLAVAAERQDDWHTAVSWWERAVEHDPHNSRVVLRLVASLVRLGDRGNAKLAWEAHRRRLATELDLEPDAAATAEVERLIRRISPTAVHATPATPHASADLKRGGGEAMGPDRRPDEPRDTGPPPASAHRAIRRWRYLAAAAVAAPLLIVIGQKLFGERAGARVVNPASIAVLPCSNLGAADAETVRIVDALHDELLAQLARVGRIQPISRTSVMEYGDSARPPLSEIASALGVSRVIECQVQVAGDSLLVTVEMTDAISGRRVWTEQFDHTMTDAFALTSDVVRRIAATVGGAAGAPEADAMRAPPTSDPEAYLLYLQGHEYWSRPGRDRANFAVAQDLYERALRRDPQFALAHAALSELHGRMYSDRYDPSPARLAAQTKEAAIALRLAPTMAQAHVAQGLVHYWGRREYAAAIDQFRTARAGLPNDVSVLLYTGYVHRRLGNWDTVLRLQQAAVRLDPRNADLYYDLGGHSLHVMHRWADAQAVFDRALELTAGSHTSAAVHRALTLATARGDLAPLRRVIERFTPDAEVGPHGVVRDYALQLALWERRGEDLVRLTSPERPYVVEGAEALWPSAMFAAWGHQLRRDSTAARAAFGRALRVLDSLRAQLPQDWRIHAARGIALAELDRTHDAEEELRWLEASRVYREDAFFSSLIAERCAWILARLGKPDAALRDVARIVNGPSWQSASLLRIDPRWDRLRGTPAFEAALAAPLASGR